MPAPDDTTPIAHALEAAWKTIQQHHPDVPDATITVASADGDRYEHRGDRLAITLGRATLRRGGPATLAALLRGAAQGLARERGVRATSREGRYLNRRFRTLGEEVGLEFGALDRRAGASRFAAGAAAVVRYADAIAAVEAATPDALRRHAGPPRGQRAAACRCPRKIRVAKTVLERGPIVCTICGEPFELVDPPTMN